MGPLDVLAPAALEPGWATSLPAILGALVVVLEIAIVVAALGVIPGNRRPSTGMAWLILVLAVPLFGLLAFLMFGSARVERRRQHTQERVNQEIHRRTAQIAGLTEVAPEPRLRVLGRPPQPAARGPAGRRRQLGASSSPTTSSRSPR